MEWSIETGDLLLSQGRFDEADRHFEAMARQRPDDPAPLAGLVRVGRRRRDMEELSARLELFLKLCPDALEERANRAQISVRRGDVERGELELPELMALAEKVSFDRKTGRRLLHLIQFCLRGIHWTEAMIRLKELAERNVADLEAGSTGSETRRESGERAAGFLPPLFSLRIFLAEIHLALGDHDAFAEAVSSLPKGNRHCRDLHRVREKIASKDYPDFEREKIFGIGLSRTGTTSLNAALGQLGYHSIHWANPMTMDLIGQEDFVLYDAFTDIPVCNQFEALYHAFPNSKFILTTRDPESWERSVTRHYFNTVGHDTIASVSRSPSNRKFRDKAAFVHQGVYGAFDNWLDAQEAYHRRVRAFFSDKPKDRFLEMNIVGGDGFEKLCAFLGVPAPEKPFPKNNAGAMLTTTSVKR